MIEPQIHEMATEYTYAALPDGHQLRRYFTVHVSYRGRGTWAVMQKSTGECLGTNGRWDYEPSPSERDDDWLAAHRFDLPTAQRLAREVVPNLSVNGWTLEQILARDAQQEGR